MIQELMPIPRLTKWYPFIYPCFLLMAEEVGVEPTRHLLSTSLVLKTRHPTGDVSLPSVAFFQNIFYSLLINDYSLCPESFSKTD